MELQNARWSGGLPRVAGQGPGGTACQDIDARESTRANLQGVGGTEAEQDAYVAILSRS